MTSLKAGDDLGALAGGLPYLPTQREVYAGNINEYAAAMAAGTWDWQRTAAIAQVSIPEGVIKLLPTVTARPVKRWKQVVVLDGYRP